ncbi:MAG: shikimate kinase [Desulfobacteraceae bacterium]|jgi:shikimate kinase
MKIVIIGYRGTGKSAVGTMVAQRLNFGYFCMDKIIEERAGKTINQIVKEQGWPAFRDLEYEMAKELSLKDRIIVDTGGGIIERPENMIHLSKNACVIWLRASVDAIVSRIQKATNRPALTQGKTFVEEVADVLAQRTDKYQSAAHYEINTDPLTPEQTADRVLAIWKTADS